MGCRDSKNRLINRGDLVVVIYPHVKWDWSRYKLGDLGIVMRKIDYAEYSVVKVKLFRTHKIETIPLEYVCLLGGKDGSGGSGSAD